MEKRLWGQTIYFLFISPVNKLPDPSYNGQQKNEESYFLPPTARAHGMGDL
jgi:hypothetical protein